MHYTCLVCAASVSTCVQAHLPNPVLIDPGTNDTVPATCHAREGENRLL